MLERVTKVVLRNPILIIQTKEKEMIWIPTVTFLNTAGQDRSLRDNKSLVTIERLGQYHHSDVSSAKNIYIYSGLDNTLKITRVYSTKWLCNYDMLWFPFDTQVIPT